MLALRTSTADESPRVALNPAQREAVTATERPAARRSPARAAARRASSPTASRTWSASTGVDPRRILAVTFTNKAAGEMRERVEELLGRPAAACRWVATFHSACARILRRDAEPRRASRRRFVIYDEDDSLSAGQGVLRRARRSTSARSRRAAVAARIGHAQERDADAADVEQLARTPRERARRARSTRITSSACRPRRASTSTTCSCATVRLFERRPGRARLVPRALELRPGRRVPGHQPRPVPARRSSLTAGAPQPLRGRRRRPVDLSLARRRPPQHPRLREGLPGRRVVVLEQNYRSTKRILDRRRA